MKWKKFHCIYSKLQVNPSSSLKIFIKVKPFNDPHSIIYSRNKLTTHSIRKKKKFLILKFHNVIRIVFVIIKQQKRNCRQEEKLFIVKHLVKRENFSSKQYENHLKHENTIHIFMQTKQTEQEENKDSLVKMQQESKFYHEKCFKEDRVRVVECDETCRL